MTRNCDNISWTTIRKSLHKKYHNFFHRGDPNNFIKQQEQDQLKKELCEENWIVLRYVLVL